MTEEHLDAATDEAGSTPARDVEREKVDRDGRRAFLNSAMRNLSEEELGSVAARRFLLAEIQRLDSECDEHRVLSKEHNDLRVRYATLLEASKTNKWLEILSFISASVGAAGLGAAPSYINIVELATVGWVFAIGSVVLLISSILFKVLR